MCSIVCLTHPWTYHCSFGYLSLSRHWPAHTRAANGGQLPYVACVQLDRSQNHLMAQEDGLNAKKTKKGRGYKDTNPHIRPTTWPRHLNTRFGREYNCLADGLCEQRKQDVHAWMAEHGDIFDLQVVGWKGLEWLAKERGVTNAAALKLPELIDVVSAFPDFANEVSAV